MRETIDESVSLAKAGKTSATYLLVLEPSHPLRFIVDAGNQVRSLHATSAGKAFLGSLRPDEFEPWLKTAKLVPMTAKTIRSKTALRADIETVEDAAAISSIRRKASTTPPPCRRSFAGMAPITSSRLPGRPRA